MAFYPCLLLNQAYFDNDLLAQFGPWRAFLKDQLAHGHFPLWNPYLLGGQPFFADLQNMMLYPLNYLTLPFSIPYGLSVFFFLHMVLAAIGMHLWLKSLQLSETSCRMGSLLFAFSNFFWLELIHPPVLAAFAWLPWFFASLEVLSRGLKPRKAFYAGLAFAMLFLCGSFQVTVGALYGSLTYFSFRFWTARKSAKSPSKIRAKSILWIALLFLWGTLPLLAQLIPTLEFTTLTDRKAPNQSHEAFSALWSLPPKTLTQFFFPRISVPAGQDMAEALQKGARDKGDPLFANWGYLGIWVFFLFLFAFQRKEKNLLYFLGIFLITGLIISFGTYTPFHHLASLTLPGFSLIRVPYRFLYLYVLAASVLAAFGFEQWRLGLDKSSRFLDRLKFPLIYVFVLGLPILFKPVQTWREAGAFALGLAGLVLCGLAPSRKKLGVLLFQTALILPLLLNGWANFVPGPASNFDYEKNSKPLGEISESSRPYRLIFDSPRLFYPMEVHGQKYQLNYPQNAACMLKIRNFGGYNPLTLESKKDLDTLPLSALIHLGAIRGILTQTDHGKIPGFALKPLKPYLLYEYQEPLSYLYAPTNLTVIPDRAKRLEALAKPDFDVSRQALLSEETSFSGTVSPSDPKVSYKTDLDEVDEQQFTVELGHDNLVVFAETMFPGWKAWVDGVPTPVFTADHLLRSVYLKAGRHQVTFRFAPDWARPLFGGLLVWLMLTLGFFLFQPRRTR